MEFKLLDKYCKTYGSRFSKREKLKFTKAIIQDFEELGYTSDVQTFRGKIKKITNIYIGNPKQAKYIFIVPYNTPPKILWYKNNIYPHDGYYNHRKLFIPTFIPMFIAYAILLLMLFMIPQSSNTLLSSILFIIYIMYMIGLFTFVFSGLKNRHNYVNNSASIALAYEVAATLPIAKRKELLFIFTDGNKMPNTVGNKNVNQYLNEHHKTGASICTLYCIGRGDTIQILHDKGSKNTARDMTKNYKTSKTRLYSINDSAKHGTIIESLPKALMVSSGELDNDKLCVRHTATSKDKTLDSAILEDTFQMLKRWVRD